MVTVEMRPELCRALSGLCRLTTVGLSGLCRDSVGTLSGFSVGLSNRGSNSVNRSTRPIDLALVSVEET